MSNSLPSGALGLSIVVIVYTTICLLAGLLLFYLLWIQERRWTYVLILSVLVSIATLASLIQQLHFAVDWRSIKTAQYAMRGQLNRNAGTAISNGSTGLDLGLFWIQFYTYNANALLILFWAVMLFCGTWRFYPKLSWLGPLANHVETCSKIFAILFPVFLLSIAQVSTISSSQFIFAIFCNANLVISTSAGAVLIFLTLYKFIQARRGLNGSTFSTTSPSGMATGTGTGEHSNQAKRNQRAIDRAIIVRFTVAFIILSIFEVCDIIIQVLSFQNAQKAQDISRSKASYFSTSDAITDIAIFIPGVTCGLIAWAIWGTTKSFLATTKEIFAFLFCCGCCTRKSKKNGEVKESFRRLSSGKDGGALRNSVKGNLNDIRVETELTIFRSTSNKDLSNKVPGGGYTVQHLGLSKGSHRATVTSVV